MLGFRGCRLGIVYPEISEMQARAVFEAAAEVQKAGIKVKPEVMIPLVGFKKELDLQVEIVHRVAKEVMAEKKVKLELPGRHHDRSPARRADRRRDRADRRVLQLRHQRPDPDLPRHEPRRLRHASCRPTPELEIFKKNPFASIDQTGVGQLMKIAVEKGRKHPSRTSSSASAANTVATRTRVKFCHKLGLTYVSCSPFRVPVARLAAAQAALEEEAAKAAKKGEEEVAL